MPVEISGETWTWTAAFVASLLLWAYHAILTNPETGSEYAKIHLPLVNFLCVGFIGVLIVALLTQVFLQGHEPPGLGETTLLLWFAFTLSAAYCSPWGRWARFLACGVLLLLPLLAGSFVLKRPSIGEQLSAYNEFMGKAGTSNSTFKLVRFTFLERPTITCPEGETTCLDLARTLESRRGLPYTVPTIVYWFVAIFSITRYYGYVYAAKEEQARKERFDYDLKRGVIAQSAAVLSVGASMFVALLLGGVSFSQLGLFGGLIAAGVSVALRDTLGNFAAGVVLLWDGTIRKDDVVTIAKSENPEAGGTYGIVDDVRLRYTLIRDRDTVHRLIPNSVLINSVVENWTHDADRKVRLKVDIPVPYHADTKEVRRILESSCYEVGRVLSSPAPRALLTKFADSSMTYSLRFWIRDPENGIRSVISEVFNFCVLRLREAKITIPFPQLDLRVKEIQGWGDGKPADETPRMRQERVRAEGVEIAAPEEKAE